MSNIHRKPSDVVTVNGLREYLDKGWELHILSRNDAELRGPQWHGSWFFLGVNPTTDEWVVLVTTRDYRKARNLLSKQSSTSDTHEIEFREVKTASGVFKLLQELGFSGVGLDLGGGNSVVLRYADHRDISPKN